MATAQDVEHRKMSSNSPGPSAPQISGRGTRIAESQGSLSQLRVEVTVLRARVPGIKKQLGLKRRFFVTLTNHATMKTKSVQIDGDGQTVHWNQTLGPFSAQQSSPIILYLYEKRRLHRDAVIGTHQILIPAESQSDVPVEISDGDGEAGKSTIIYLTITVSSDATSPIVSSTPEELTKGDNSTNEEPTKPTPVQAEMSPTEEALIALHLADDTKKRIDRRDIWSGAVSRIKRVMDTVSPIAELHPFAKMAYGLVSAIPGILLEQYERDENVLTLLGAMHDAFDFAQDENTLKLESIKPDSRQAKILTTMLRDVCSCSDFIRSYAKDEQFWKQALKNIGGRVAEDVAALSAGLAEHRRVFLEQATITTEITAFQILDGVGILSDKVDEISTQLKSVSSQVSDAELEAKIREIPYGTGSRFTPDKACLPGTRTAFLDFIVDWANDPASERCLVLFGQAGTGKSAIAHEVARRFKKMGRLTSSFIFSRKERSKQEAYHLFTTLARDLSDRYPSFKTALGRVIKDDSSLRAGTRDYGTLFESLILEPLKDLHIVGPILVVIDALDESGDATGRTTLHSFLAKNLSSLPSNFRVFITSRPEDGIEPALIGAPSFKIRDMKDSELAAEAHNDILAFIRERLPSGEFRSYDDALAIKAEGLFQWAAVASQFILDPPGRFGYSAKKCINHLTSSANRDGQDPLDELYQEVLEGYFTEPEARVLFRSVVGQLITSFEPLSIRSLITLRRYASDDDDGDGVVGLLRRLGSLLSNVNSPDANLPITPLHTSFRDFLTNKKKSREFCVDLRDAHRHLARSCLGLLLESLKFNICNLESSYLANKDVKDLRSRVDKHIPVALLYACRFWEDHLEHIDFEPDLFDQLRTFFENKFLFWLEALSVTGNVGLTLPALSALNVWLASNHDQADVEKFRSFVIDASMFVRYFGMAMTKSAPHIYLSALPFAPIRSVVSAHYINSFPRILRVERGRLSDWPSSEMVIPNVGDGVYSIALSPNGQRIISGSKDGTIRVWNATTGETEAGPLTGHTASVWSVAFSPDGLRIVSGSPDRTIRVWNATTGETEAGPLTGHTQPVVSVAFSPDGQRIVSGSLDGTIRVWNATTGETEAGPLTGHTNSVRSVAFSPDGQRIVSGSEDRTIRVWNATTGETEADPLTGHTNSVFSVAFSPDGQQIVSGSQDGTIRVWNATTGETEAGPLTGHTNSVISVAFSPDGQRIVSGSPDRTIRVWNATMGETEIGRLTGHMDSVRSVAFSPDGQRIVSGSADRTIRVWNATTGETGAGPLIGHTNSVLSVALSPDGQRIVSGSRDRTIRVWNATTGETEAGPLIGHTNSVYSVAFSPDGQRIVSGSHDRTIRVWNATTGEAETGPLTGHTDWVFSVAFSPDGQRIVSGSGDRTIRVWNATTGETEAGPLTGHTDSVWSVAFSPDGQRIVSGSDDRTIRVWNATTGETEAGPLTGHTNSVFSVAFSPDGQRIVSGSRDQTIRVWNTTTGETEAGPFTVHTSSVLSVAFSPDGLRIVSGSDDRTVRMWNAAMGETEAGPSIGDTDPVESAAFSPDENTETIRHVAIDDHTVIDEEGWICGSKGELLMWIPEVHRAHLHRLGVVWVAGARETRLDLSPFVHGRNWTTCINT